MTQAEPASVPRSFEWDAVIVVLLGAALLAAGWLDVRAYLIRGHKIPPTFAFLQPPGGERAATEELFRRGQSLAMLENIGGLEATQGDRFRHGFGPHCSVLISTPFSHALLNVKYFNAVPDQDITVVSGGRVLEQFTHQPAGDIVRKYPLTLHPGLNDITFVFARYNHAGIELAGTDFRPMAGMFRALDLTLY